jgi:hypothetical protein
VATVSLNDGVKSSLKQILLIKEYLAYKEYCFDQLKKVNPDSQFKAQPDRRLELFDGLLAQINTDTATQRAVRELFGLTGSGNISGREIENALLQQKEWTYDLKDALTKIDESSLAEPVKGALKQILLIKEYLAYKRYCLDQLQTVNSGSQFKAQPDRRLELFDGLLAQINTDAATQQAVRTLFGLTGTGNISGRELDQAVLKLKSSSLDLFLAFCVIEQGASAASLRPHCLDDKFGAFELSPGNLSLDVDASALIGIEKKLADSDTYKNVTFNIGAGYIAFYLSDEFASVPAAERGDIVFEYWDNSAWSTLANGVNLIDTSSAGDKSVKIRAKWNGWVIQEQTLTIEVKVKEEAPLPPPPPPGIDVGSLRRSASSTNIPANSWLNNWFGTARIYRDPGSTGTALRFETERHTYLMDDATGYYTDPLQDVERGDLRFGTQARFGGSYTGRPGSKNYYLKSMPKGWNWDGEFRPMVTAPIPFRNKGFSFTDLSSVSLGGYAASDSQDSKSAAGGVLRAYDWLHLRPEGKWGFALLREGWVDYGHRQHTNPYPSLLSPDGDLKRWEIEARTGWRSFNLGPRIVDESGEEAIGYTFVDASADPVLDYKSITRHLAMGKVAIDGRGISEWLPVTLDAQFGKMTHTRYGLEDSFEAAGEPFEDSLTASGTYLDSRRSYVGSIAGEVQFGERRYSSFLPVRVGGRVFGEWAAKRAGLMPSLESGLASSSWGVHIDAGNILRASVQSTRQAGDPSGYIPSQKSLEMDLSAAVPVAPRCLLRNRGVAITVNPHLGWRRDTLSDVAEADGARRSVSGGVEVSGKIGQVKTAKVFPHRGAEIEISRTVRLADAENIIISDGLLRRHGIDPELYIELDLVDASSSHVVGTSQPQKDKHGNECGWIFDLSKDTEMAAFIGDANRQEMVLELRLVGKVERSTSEPLLEDLGTIEITVKKPKKKE